MTPSDGAGPRPSSRNISPVARRSCAAMSARRTDGWRRAARRSPIKDSATSPIPPASPDGSARCATRTWGRSGRTTGRWRCGCSITGSFANKSVNSSIPSDALTSPPGERHPTRLLSVLMPVFNERRTLRTIVGRVLASPVTIPLELIAVDDGSRDGSAEILRDLADHDPRVRPIVHARNLGKGAAIQTAIRHMSGDVAIVQDADLEYDPAEIPRVIQPILDGRADAVFGSRFLNADYRRVLYYWHSLGNGVLTWLTNVLCDLNLTDMETCYKAVRSDILKQTPLHFNDFALEPELAIRLAQWGVRLYEVPISYSGRTYVEGKKIGWKDGLRALWAMFRCRFLDTRFTTHDGYYILVAVRNARAFNRWMYDQIAPYAGRRVLEAGCGIGNLTELLLDCDRLVASDFDPFYVEMIGRRFGHLENFRAVPMDLTRAEDYAQLDGEQLDTIICMN